MKCISCNIEIPPLFTRAIVDNICPACGKNIFSVSDFENFNSTKASLIDAGLDDNLTITVAASIFQKFDLVLKGSTNIANKRVVSVHAKHLVGDASILTEEDKSKLQALREARDEKDLEDSEEIRKEWGLDNEPIAYESVKGKAKPISPEMMALFDAPGGSGIDVDISPLDIPMARNNAKHAELLARASALKNDPSKFKVARSG